MPSQATAAAEPTLPGQESVWNYPPAVAQAIEAHVVVALGGEGNVGRGHARDEPSAELLSVPDAIRAGALVPAAGSSFCERKGRARYFDLVGGGKCRPRAAGSYPDPFAEFAVLCDHVAFYAATMDACFVDGERIVPQPGGFYGGWITSLVAGPLKGGSGSAGW